MAQAVHATNTSVTGPVPEATHAVVLAASSEQALLDLAARLSAVGLAHVLVREPDAPWNGAATAIGLAPVDAAGRAAVRRLTSSMPLYGREPRCADCAAAGGLCYHCNGGLARRYVATAGDGGAPMP